MSRDSKSPLVFLVGTGKRGVPGQNYLDQVLKPVIGPAFNRQLGYSSYEQGGLYVKDHAPIHGMKGLLVKVEEELGIPLHDRPSCSPDLNPIENIWRTMKQRIKARSRFPATVAEMRAVVQEEWDRLQPAGWNKYIDEMPAKIAEVVQRRGMQTRY